MAEKYGFSVETDLRDVNCEISFSHDPTMLDQINRISLPDYDLSFALNVKADGLFNLLDEETIEHIKSSDSYFFDGSVPQMYQYKKRGIRHAMRLSEYEGDLPWETPVIWVDGFEDEWWIRNNSIKQLSESHLMVFVSPEIHGRSSSAAWDEILNLETIFPGNIGICTDKPLAFANFASLKLIED